MDYSKYPSNVPANRIRDGRILSHKEMTAGQEEARHAARAAQALADREAEASKSELQKRIELHRRVIADAKANGDRAKAAMHAEKLSDLLDQRDLEIAAQKKSAAFSADPRIQKIRAHADWLEGDGKKHYPDAGVELGMLVALARNDGDFPTVESQVAEFNYLADRLDAAALAAARTRASDKEHATLKAEVEHAESAVQVSEIELARHRRTVTDGQ